MFQELKVLELASVLAGPLTGTFFAELGAKVVKIENSLTKGDVTRTWRLPNESKDNAISAYYSSANFGKDVKMLNLKDEGDYRKVVALIKEADVVIQNYKPGTAEKLHLDFDAVNKINPKIIYASLTGFGENDTRPAFDVVLQAETGFMFMNGEPDDKPVKMPVALIDVLAAHHMKEAILCALINKLKTGNGKHIEVSLYEAALASLSNQATNWLMQKHIPKAMGTLHPNIAPYGDMFLTKDGKHLVLAVGSDKHFATLCDTLKIEANGFETNADRVSNRAALHKILAAVIAQKDAAEWNALMLANNVPFGIVKNMKEVFENEHAQATLLHENIEGVETVRVKTALI